MSLPKDDDNMEVDFQDPLEGIGDQVNNSPSDIETETMDLISYINTDEPFDDTEANDSLNKIETKELIIDFTEEDPIADQLELDVSIHKAEREPVIDLELEESITCIAKPIIVLEPEDLDEFSQPPSPEKQRTQDGIDIDAESSNYSREKLMIQSYFDAKANHFSRKADAIQENIATVTNVLHACKNIRSSNVRLPAGSGPQKKLQYLEYITKDDLNYLLETIEIDSKLEKKATSHLTKTLQPIPVKVQKFIYDDIRNIFVQFYVKNRDIPTKLDFMKTFLTMRSQDYTGIFIEILINSNLIKYHHLPKLNRYIITEHPELLYKRHRFLRQISESRSRASIMYVSIKIPNMQTQTPKYFAIAASSAGLIEKSENIKYRDGDDEFENPEIRLWIQHDLMPKIEPGWIIHLTTIRKKDTTPTAFSSKTEMLDWLMQREIPCDANFHAAQLYALIKLHREIPKCLYEDLFTCAGFQVVNCPVEYKSLDFFRDINTEAVEFPDAMRIEQSLVFEEKQMENEDAEMDRIVNNLFAMVKNGDVTANDFPHGCQGTNGDNVYAHIGDIIV